MRGFLFDRQKSLVGLFKGKDGDLRPNIEIASDRQEVSRVLSGHISHTTDLSLAPKQFVVVKHRHVVEMNGVNRHHATFA